MVAAPASGAIRRSTEPSLLDAACGMRIPAEDHGHPQAALHAWVETTHLLGENSPLYLVATTLYPISCAYAAVVFGARGQR